MMMRKRLWVLALAWAAGAAQAAVGVGDQAPDFRLRSAGGETVALSDFPGRTVILEWTNHDCPFVRKHYESDNMQALQRRYAPDEAVWLSIISSAPGKQGHVSAEQARALTASRKAAPSHVLFDPDGTVGRAYGAKTTPHMFVIAGNSRTVRYMGAIDSIRSADPGDIPEATNYVDMAMSALARGEPPQPPATRPYGCSVKY